MWLKGSNSTRLEYNSWMCACENLSNLITKTQMNRQFSILHGLDPNLGPLPPSNNAHGHYATMTIFVYYTRIIFLQAIIFKITINRSSEPNYCRLFPNGHVCVLFRSINISDKLGLFMIVT